MAAPKHEHGMRSNQMKQLMRRARCGGRAFLVVLVIGLACDAANAQLTVIGTQFQPNQIFPEFAAFWHEDSYPTGPYPTDIPGATVHVYVKNIGASPVTISDATLAGYSLATPSRHKAVGAATLTSAASIIAGEAPSGRLIAAGPPVWYRLIRRWSCRAGWHKWQ